MDDVGFARSMVAALSSAGVLFNASRVWVSGFSNGAMMSEVIGCSAADVFSASASVSGVVELEPGNDGGLAVCDKQFAPLRAANRSLAVFHVHGLDDNVVPFTGDALLGFPPIMENMARWLQRVGCQQYGNSSHTPFRHVQQCHLVELHCVCRCDQLDVDCLYRGCWRCCFSSRHSQYAVRSVGGECGRRSRVACRSLLRHHSRYRRLLLPIGGAPPGGRHEERGGGELASMRSVSH